MITRKVITHYAGETATSSEIEVNMHISYSTLFTTIYDEATPIGNLGRGTHYSILRSTESCDSLLDELNHFQIHDFAVIWDEDHDTRIINIIEKLYISKLLSPLVFIGERKGGVTAIVEKEFYYSNGSCAYFHSRLVDIAKDSNDPWCVEVGYYDRETDSVCISSEVIINAPSKQVSTYLNNIDNLWELGLKEHSVNRS
ncbi:TPA: hypothetical protein ACF4E7_004669 [Vibrio parahaemolyticus]|uniref:hypothetical protein n=1 Tax=Vibrio harveyi TaxID=669 RepID=UPI000C0345BD|nr:hypothetical protein [Vibrio parahaemolyticus]PHZ60369.1 hypothetical protein CRG86_004525 [Photobacterium leiognathi]HCE1970443.1 hypothetical protein [Vibrio parahaemolyticus]